MFRLNGPIVLPCLLICILPGLANSASPEVDFGLRTRWETAEEGQQKAHALTAKLRLDVKYNVAENLDAFLQLDHVSSLNNDKHSDGVNQNTHPTIADPEGTEINQAKLQFDWMETLFMVGRQNITFGDQRFIGDVGFRQNDQTYDAIQLEHNLFSGSKLNLAYVHNVNRIFGDEADASLSPDDIRYTALNGVRPNAQRGNHHIDGVLVHFNFNELDHIEINTYGYAVHNYHVSAFSNRTVGVEGHYRNKFGDFKTLTSAELAFQKQQAKATDWIAYRKVSASIGYKQIELGLRHEVLSERDDVAFITPLATLHKFQGWADQFLVTPSVGLQDHSASIKWESRPWTVDIRYHFFESSDGRIDIGEELDMDFIYKPSRQHEIKLRIADFNHDPDQSIKTSDVRKMFLMYSYNL